MIPQKPEILKAPLVVDGEKNILPETTPQGSNQFSLLGGFPTLTSLQVNAGGLPPKRLDFNAVFNLLSIHTFFLQSGNKYGWDALLDYSIGSTVLGSDNSVYFCIQPNGATPPNTVQDPVSSSGYWVELVKSNGTINIDLIATGTISTDKIANGAITSDKLANNAVISAKIANSAVNDDKISDVDVSKITGILPISKGGTGLTYGALGKASIAQKLDPSQPNGTNYKSGDVIYRYSLALSGVKLYVPAGGTWLVQSIVFSGDGRQAFVEYGDTYLCSGGSQLDTNPDVDFIHILTKIS